MKLTNVDKVFCEHVKAAMKHSMGMEEEIFETHGPLREKHNDALMTCLAKAHEISDRLKAILKEAEE